MPLVAFPTSFAIAGPFQAAAEIIPVLRMRVDPQAGCCAVTLEADIPFGVAGLAGGQVLARLARVAAGPRVRRQDRVGMAGLAAILGERRMRGPRDTQVAPSATVGQNSQIRRRETVVAVEAEVLLVAAGAQLGVGACRDRVGYLKIAAMHIDHVVAELAHLVGAPRDMTLQAIALLVAGCTVISAALGKGAMVKGPYRTVGREPREFDGIDKILVVALQAHRELGSDGPGSFDVTGRAGRTFHVSQMCGVVEIDRQCR